MACEIAAIKNRILSSATLVAASVDPYLHREIGGTICILRHPDVEVEAMITRSTLIAGCKIQG